MAAGLLFILLRKKFTEGIGMHFSVRLLGCGAVWAFAMMQNGCLRRRPGQAMIFGTVAAMRANRHTQRNESTYGKEALLDYRRIGNACAVRLMGARFGRRADAGARQRVCRRRDGGGRARIASDGTPGFGASANRQCRSRAGANANRSCPGSRSRAGANCPGSRRIA